MNECLSPRIVAALAMAALLAGCGLDRSGEGRHPGEISRIKRGMNVLQVENEIGPPIYANEGQDEKSGQDVWVYKKGYIMMHRQSVRAVVPVDNPRNLPPRQMPRDVVTSTRNLDIFTEEDDYYRHRREKTGVEVRPDQWDENIYRTHR